MVNLLLEDRDEELLRLEHHLKYGNTIWGGGELVLVQSCEGFHVREKNLKNFCGDLIFDFNIIVFSVGEVVTIEVFFKDETIIAFRSADHSDVKLPKCLGEAIRYMEEIVPEKPEVIRAILLTLVNDFLFIEEDRESYLRTVELYNRELLQQQVKP